MTTKNCKVCSHEPAYTEITCYHGSYQVIDVSYACDQHVETPGLDTSGRDTIVTPQILSRQEAQFFVYHFNFADL